MDNHQVNDDLILKHLLGMTDEVENSSIRRWLNLDPERQKYVDAIQEKLEETLRDHRLLQLDMDVEWGHHEMNRQLHLAQPLSPELPYPPHRSNMRSLLQKMAIAASIAAIVFLTLNYIWKSAPEQQRSVAVAVNDTIEAKRHINRYVNNTGKVKNITLPDGSAVSMENNSELTYADGFNRTDRVLTVAGEVDFDVFKDASKPFTVLTGYTSITALGTRFKVKAPDDKERMELVRLYEGRVVVRALRGKEASEHFLLPGQELRYDRANLIAAISEFRTSTAKRKTRKQDEISIPHDYKGTWYMFNNQSLEYVFEELEKMYSVKINYKREDLANIYFIGRFDMNDSIENVIRKITRVNNLKFSRNENTFTVTK